MGDRGAWSIAPLGVGLLASGSHRVADVAFGRHGAGSRPLARPDLSPAE